MTKTGACGGTTMAPQRHIGKNEFVVSGKIGQRMLRENRASRRRLASAWAEIDKKATQEKQP